MGTRKCRGCERFVEVTVRQLRIYERRKQHLFQLTLCKTCFEGLFDLIRLSADGWLDSVWEPFDQKANSQ